MNKKILSLIVGITACAGSTQAAIVVNDTWLDSTRNDPASPVYSEHGVDSDFDGNIESAWFNGGSGATLAPTPGHLLMTPGTGSASWTTYYTAAASPITLGSAGDQLKVTWAFTPNSVNLANASQNFRMAIVNTPAASRLSADGAPGTAAYTGYAMFMNMAQTLGNSNPFRLMERTNPSGALLSASAEWSALANGATTGNHGYDSGTLYTYTMTLTRNVANGLDIVSTMTGGTLNNSGTATVSFTDATPNGGSFTFDTFSLRPSDIATTAASLDTSVFQVEFTPVPEPSILALGAMAALGFAASRRWARR